MTPPRPPWTDSFKQCDGSQSLSRRFRLPCRARSGPLVREGSRDTSPPPPRPDRRPGRWSPSGSRCSQPRPSSIAADAPNAPMSTDAGVGALSARRLLPGGVGECTGSGQVLPLAEGWSRWRRVTNSGLVAPPPVGRRLSRRPKAAVPAALRPAEAPQLHFPAAGSCGSGGSPRGGLAPRRPLRAGTRASWSAATHRGPVRPPPAHSHFEKRDTAAAAPPARMAARHGMDRATMAP